MSTPAKLPPTKVVYQPACHTCDGLCCRHIAIQLDTPTNKTDYDHLRWFLMHEKVRVGIDLDGNWTLEVATPCQYLQADYRCGIYDDRPRICKAYPGKDECCEHEADTSPYRVLFTDHKQLEKYLAEKNVDWRWKA
jgi:Fe-S-cluster containining protein